MITRKTYAAANAIFHQTKYVSDIVKLSLIESYVLPILTYAIEAIWLTPVQVQELSVCVNNMYRRIFGMNRWESVKLVQFFCGRLDFCIGYNYHLRKLCFLSKILAGKHLLLNECFLLCANSEQGKSLLCEYDLTRNNLITPSVVKCVVSDKFSDLCNNYF